jgi:hypothetical protein
MTSFGPINTGQTGVSGALGGVSTGVEEFLRAAQGMMAIQKAKHDQMEQQGTELLTLYGRAAQGKPQLLDDPNFQAQVTGIAGKLGMKVGGAGLPGTGNEIAGILGLPTAQDVLAQPGVMADVEQAPPEQRRSMIEARLGRPLTDEEAQRISAAPQQFPPAQTASMLNALSREQAAAEKTAATQANPTALVEFFRGREALFERLYGADATKQLVASALSTNLGQMTALQLSTLAKNKAYTAYLHDKGVEINDLLSAKKAELLSRSVAERARAANLNAQTTLIPARLKNLRAMTGFFDGRSENEHWQAQQTRENVETYLATGMTQGDISKTRSDYMVLIAKNRSLLAGLQKQLQAARALGDDDTVKGVQQQINDEQQVFKGDVDALNALNARFAKGVLSPMDDTTAPAGGTTPSGVTPGGGLPQGAKPYGSYTDGRTVYITPDGQYVFQDGTAVPQ